jgi:hypothetical protein
MLAAARKPRPKIRREMTPAARKRKLIKDYVLRRLKEEIEAGPRGTKAKLSRKIGITTAHMTNISASGTRGIGEDVRDKLAAHWGITTAQLEALAQGLPVSGVAPMPDPPYKELTSQLQMLPALQAELLKKDAHWRTSTVVRAVTTYWESPDGAPREGWVKILEAIESGEIDQMSGGAEEASKAAKKQVGPRVKLGKPPHTP